MAIKTDKQLAKEIGKRIRAIRKAKGISLKSFEASEHSTMSRHSLSDIENGKKLPSVYTAYRISKVLEVPFHQLFIEMD